MSDPVGLFLDDERRPHDVTWITLPAAQWHVVRTPEEFSQWIMANGLPQFLSFDNDLGEGVCEGIDCAHWIVERVLDGDVQWRPFEFTVHSKNPVAALRIQSLLDSFARHMAELQ